MRSAALLVAACDCLVPQHEGRCPGAWVFAERGRLYDGLYDARTARRALPSSLGRVRLLNPGYVDEDPAARRFALLEID